MFIGIAYSDTEAACPTKIAQSVEHVGRIWDEKGIRSNLAKYVQTRFDQAWREPVE